MLPRRPSRSRPTTARATGSCSPWCSTTRWSSTACGDCDAADLDQRAREYLRQLELDHVVTVTDGDVLDDEAVARPAQAAGPGDGVPGRSADLLVRRMGGRPGPGVPQDLLPAAAAGVESAAARPWWPSRTTTATSPRPTGSSNSKKEKWWRPSATNRRRKRSWRNAVKPRSLTSARNQEANGERA